MGDEMDTSIIDELYDIYQVEDVLEACYHFSLKKIKMEAMGDFSLIPTIKDYIQSQTIKLGSYFISDKDESNKKFDLSNDVVLAFESVASAANYYMVDFLYANDIDSRESAKFYEQIKVQDLFTINFDFLDKACEEYLEVAGDCYEGVKKLIDYVRKNKILDKLYDNNGWRNINIEELLLAIYDKIEDKSLFENIRSYMPDQEYLFFHNLKGNCDNSNIKFDKYRPILSCTKQMRADFGKLIFCKNLLNFYQIGIMPDNEGRLECAVDEEEQMVLMDNFKKVYNKNFDSAEFRKNQGNIICNPEVVADNFKIEAAKKVTQGDKLIVGFLISTGNEIVDSRINYLLHIEVSDVNNPCSNYEMQLNLLPRGAISQRLQLIRLDNWETEQPHKNIAKKLSTTTHLHIYNEFDLLRGKTNGAFDIKYNLESSSTDFNTSLKEFLKILDFDYDIQNKIYKATMRCFKNEKKETKEAEV